MLPPLPTVNLLPLAIEKKPPLLKLPPVVVRFWLPAKLKLPAAELVVKPAKASTLVWLIICEVDPDKVRLAALVTMLAPLNCRVPP